MSDRTPTVLLFSALSACFVLLTPTAFAQEEVGLEVQVEASPPTTDSTPVVYAQPAPDQPAPDQPTPARPAQSAPQAQAADAERPPVHEAYRPEPIRPIPVYREPEPPRPHRLRYNPDEPIPPGGRLVERYRVGMLIAGSAMFAVSYGAGLALVGGEDGLSVLAIPLVGPFLAMREAGPIAGMFLVGDGLIQIAGLTLLVIGLTAKKRYIQMYASEDGQRTLSVLPFAGESNGIALDLTF